MAGLTQLQLPMYGMDTDDSAPFQDFRVRDPLLPSQIQYSVKAVQMEVVELPGMASVDSSGIGLLHEYCQDDGLLHLHFGAQLKAVPIAHGGLQPAKGLKDFGEQASHLIVDICVTRDVPQFTVFPSGRNPAEKIHLFIDLYGAILRSNRRDREVVFSSCEASVTIVGPLVTWPICLPLLLPLVTSGRSFVQSKSRRVDTACQKMVPQ
ncbi:hypothetical protein SprV_0200735900 [Sparganum proliferum]